MIELIVYVIIGVFSGFLTYWIAYRMAKKQLTERAESCRYTRQPTHENVKGKVLEEDIIPIILSIAAWPVALFVIYPLIGAVIGICKLFNWIIDNIEGRKYSVNSAKD